MRCPAGLAALAFTAGLSSTPAAQTAGVEIDLTHNTSKEQSEAERLRRLLGQFDLTPWLFTRRVLIDEKVPPHSHPVLTVGYGDHDDDNLLLSNFVHEQFHWWLVAHQQQTDAAISELRGLFPKSASRRARWRGHRTIVVFAPNRHLSRMAGRQSIAWRQDSRRRDGVLEGRPLPSAL